jgi:hypothetical protein
VVFAEIYSRFLFLQHFNLLRFRFNLIIVTLRVFILIDSVPAKHRGSVSAEHGIGAMKPKALHYSKTPEMIAVMKAIKKTLDPSGILNPYKVLPSDS